MRSAGNLTAEYFLLSSPSPMESLETNFRFLALGARARLNPAQSAELLQRAENAIDWNTLPTQAETHGLAPLVQHHLSAIHFPTPLLAKRELAALAARHRLASVARTRILRDILAQYADANISTLVLKGAALAYLVYPDPALRPMRDIDVLVRPSDAARAQKILRDLGFDAPLDETKDFAHRHLGAASKIVDDFHISVEVHHNLFEEGSSPRLMGLDEIQEPLKLSIGNVPAATLGFNEMLWYLCQHLVESTNVFSCVGLLWVADAINFAEKFSAEIDWQIIQKKYPLVLDTLSLLYWLMPLSDELMARARIKIGREPSGMWSDFAKQPRTTPEEIFAHGWAHALRLGLFPSAWWLRIHFGVGSARRLMPWHSARHLLYLGSRYAHVLKRQRQ